MALKTIVKVGKISNLSDARYCAGMGVDMLGFNTTAGTEHYVSPELFKEIRGWFSGPLVVTEAYGLTSAEQLLTITQNYLPDLIELSTNELGFIKPDLKYILYVTSSDWVTYASNITSLKKQIEYLLVPSTTSTDQLKQMSDQFNVLMQIDLFSELENLINEVKGISLKGSSEERPGFKNYDQLADILERLEVES